MNKKVSLLLIVCGIASISVQFFIQRIAIPYFGSSIYSNSLIVGVFLMALALGYYLGSRLKPRFELLQYIIFSAGIIYSLLVNSEVLNYFVTVFGRSYFVLFLFNLISTFPLGILFSLIPIILIGVNRTDKANVSSGRIYSMSTVGNVLGCIITSFFLVYYFGLTNAVLILSVLLFIISIYVATKVGNKVLFFLCATLIVSMRLIPTNDKSKLSTIYSDVKIIETENFKKLMVNNSLASFYNKKNSYAEYINIIRKDFFESSEDKEVLVLGGAGSTISHNDNNRYVYVEIDKLLWEFSQNNFLKTKNDGVHFEDGRRFLIENEKKWDFIVMDIYSNRINIPWHLLTQEFFNLLGSRVKENGIIIINAIHNSYFKSKFSRSLFWTIQGSIGPCEVKKIPNNMELTNFLYYCHSNKHELIYTDDSIEHEIEHFK